MAKRLLVFFIIAASLFFIYAMFKILDPNYIEFGPWVSFYKSEECVDFDTKEYTSGKGCYLYGGRDSMHKKKPKTLEEVVKNVQSRHKKIGDNKNYLEPKNGWRCWIDNRYIDNLSSEVVINSYYKCWPK